MTEQPLDIYQPRAVENLGVWPFDGLSLKAYGIVADGQGIDAEMQDLARQIVNQEVLPRVETEGASNGMGFIFIHPGALGLTISSHWWCQGSVLCQHNYRKAYAASQPLNTRDRPVVACVWELALIHAEQEIWRHMMMRPDPDPKGYLEARAPMNVV